MKEATYKIVTTIDEQVEHKTFTHEPTDAMELLRVGFALHCVSLELIEDCVGIDNWREYHEARSEVTCDEDGSVAAVVFDEDEYHAVLVRL